LPRPARTTARQGVVRRIPGGGSLPPADFSDLERGAPVVVDPRRQRIARIVVLAVMAGMTLLLIISASLAALQYTDAASKRSSAHAQKMFVPATHAEPVGGGLQGVM
jgi:hypothetical protein